MKVGPVRVAVTERFMIMPVRMPQGCGLTGVGMIVMPVVMAVHVYVFHFFVLVMMGMLIAHQKINRDTHNTAGNNLHCRESFAQKQGRKDDTKKWRRGKNHLRAGGSELLSGSDVERQTQAVGERANYQRLTYRRRSENMWLEDQS